MTRIVITDYTHITGTREHVLDVLRLKIPRALCGVSLGNHVAVWAVHPGKDVGYPAKSGPVCPECAALAGWPQCPRCGGYDLTTGLHGWPECEDCGTNMIGAPS